MGTRYGQLDAGQASDLGYLPAKVLLDGQEIKNVAVVNDIEGWIDVYKTDDTGHIQVFGEADDVHAETFRMHGDVVYIPKTALDGIDPESREPDPSDDPADDPRPTLSIPLKYCTFEIWADQRTVATVFPRGYICAGGRVDTEQNRVEAESQGYTGQEIVWRSLVEHELLHNVCAEVMFDRRSLVMETESGMARHPSWLRYEEEAIVLAYQYFINTGKEPEPLYKYPHGVYEAWFLDYAPKLKGLWGPDTHSCAERE